MNSPLNVCAVVVTYHPDFGALESLLAALTGQVAVTVVVDNGSPADYAPWIRARAQDAVVPLLLGENMGVAAAQNRGIEWARAQGCTHVVLFDQDSLPAQDMVSVLLEAADAARARGVAVAALGPRYTDERQDNPPPFIRVRGLRVERCRCLSPDSVVAVDYLIASGCLIPMDVLNAVGDMAEPLFIDYVDIEWGLRAREKGFQSLGVCKATMRHSLGEAPSCFFGRKIPVHSPLRHYYHVRNAIWLYRQAWVPLHWKWADGFRLLLKFGYYSLLTSPRIQHFWMMTLGIYHGLSKRSGRLD
ncbi:MAG: glycosyltransferase family 2 protein [Burkholderiales bacterium]